MKKYLAIAAALSLLLLAFFSGYGRMSGLQESIGDRLTKFYESIPTSDRGTGTANKSGGQSGQSTGEVVGPVRSGAQTVSDPLSDLVLVNKKRSLAEEFVPFDLTVPKILFAFDGDVPKKQMRQEAAAALEELFEEAKKEDLELAAVSGYRSYERQAAIFSQHVRSVGETEAVRISAHPGQSEHQTGLAMDVSSPSVGYKLTQVFGETKEGKWLENNADKFGFIIRYPKGKENVTGYAYEPWHIRYVGQKPAAEIMRHHLTLEEYLAG